MRVMPKEQFPIVPNSPESAYLEDLAGYLAAFEGATSGTGQGAAFDQLMRLVKDSPLSFEDKKRIRLRYLQARGKVEFGLSDLAVDEEELLEMLGMEKGSESLRAERARQLAAYVRGYVAACVEGDQSRSPEERVRSLREALLRSSPFRHWRVRHFFELQASQGKLGSMGSDALVAEFNAYWLKCEEEGMARAGKGAEIPMDHREKGSDLPSVVVNAELLANAPASIVQNQPAKLGEGEGSEGTPEAKAQALLALGQEALKQGHLKEALDFFKGARKENWNNAYVRSRVRELYELLLRTEEGVGILSAEAERDSYDSLIHTALSKYYFSIGEKEKGMRHYEKAIALNPNVKAEVTVEALTRGLSEHSKGDRKEKKGELDHLFDGIEAPDAPSQPIDLSKLGSVPGKVLKWATQAPGKVREMANQVIDAFSKPSTPSVSDEEDITPEMADAAMQSIPDAPQAAGGLAGMEEKEVDAWFENQSQVEVDQVGAEIQDPNFAQGKAALEVGDLGGARSHFSKAVRANFENETLRTAVLRVCRARGFTEMGEALACEGLDRKVGKDCLAMGNLFCGIGTLESGTLRDLVQAWNCYSQAMQMDIGLFQKLDLDALEGQIKVRAKDEGVALVLNLSRGGYSYGLPSLKKSRGVVATRAAAPQAKPAINVEAIWSLLEERGVLLDHASQTVEDILAWLSESGDVESVRMVVEAGVDPNGIDKRGNTPLLMAASGGNAEMVKALLELNADPNQPDRDGWTPLMLSIHLEHVEAVNTLIVGGAEVDRGGPHGRTALLFSAAEGKTGMVELLLSHGARVDQADENGCTALMEAAEWGHFETFKLLQGKGASIHLKNKSGLTAWDIAEQRNRAKIVDLEKGNVESPEAPVVTFGELQLVRKGPKVSTPFAVRQGEQPKPESVFNFRKQDGTLVSKKWFTYMGLSENRLRVICQDGTHNYITPEGRWLGDEGFDWVGPFENGRAKVLSGGRWHWIDLSGKNLGPVVRPPSAENDSGIPEGVVEEVNFLEPPVATPKAGAEERTDPHFVFSAPGDAAKGADQRKVPTVPKVSVAVPDKKIINDLYAILAMGEDQTEEKRNELLKAARDYMGLIRKFPKIDLKYRTFIPLLRDLWLKGVVSRDDLYLAHEKDLQVNPKKFGTLADMGQTFMAEQSYEDLEAAENFFRLALQIDPNPQAEYAEVPKWLQEVVARKRELVKQVQKKATDKEGQQSSSEATTAPGLSLVDPVTEENQPKLGGQYRVNPGVDGLVETGDLSDKKKGEGGK